MCQCSIREITIEDPATASLCCPVHGRTYLFRKPGGGWETQSERQERMKLVRVCELCEKEFTIKAAETKIRSVEQILPRTRLCPECERGETPDLVKTQAPRNNPKTPWRLRYDKGHPMRTDTCKDCGSPFWTRSTNKFRCDPCQAIANRDVIRKHLTGGR